MLGGNRAQVAPEPEHLQAAQRVVAPGAVPPAADKADLTEDLQVLTGVCDGEPGLRCEPVDSPLTVGEDVQDLEPAAVRQCLCQVGELVEKGGLGPSTVPFAAGLAYLAHVHLLEGRKYRSPSVSTIQLNA